MFSQVSIDVISPENVAWVQGLRNPQDTVEEFVETTRTMAEVLGLHIRLPEKIRIGFSDRDGYASALPGLIEFGSAARFIVGDEVPHFSTLRHALGGHELSHISDFSTGNDESDEYPAMLVDAVCEGKAELIGVHFGGECYKSLFLGTSMRTIQEDIRSLVYCERSRAKQIFKKTGGIYKVGVEIVGHVVNCVGGDIFDLHDKEPNFFLDRYFHEIG